MIAQNNIFIGENNFEELQQFLKGSYSSCFVLVDKNTEQHCYPLIKDLLPKHSIIQIKAGEAYKTIETCGLIWERLTQNNADRKSLLINLGGGVIGDMGGFAASCYKRGITFINIPTTLLAMVDASVGGKTGIDFNGFKNQIGLFSDPKAVFIYTTFLKTLADRELTSGFAEVIKHYLIADAKAFEKLAEAKPSLKALNWPQVVAANVHIKSTIVNQDPQEKDIRKALNFGHTIGHAVESFFLQQDKMKPLLHGEAVAVGLITESYLSVKKGLLTEAQLIRIQQVVINYFELPFIEVPFQKSILELLKQDKKNEQNSTQFTLLQSIGNYSIDNPVTEELIIESLNYYNSLLK